MQASAIAASAAQWAEQKAAYSNPATLYTTMSRDNKMSMPSGSGGLVRYFDEYHSKIRFKPGHILVLAGIVIVIMIILYMYGNSWLGIG